MILWKSFLKYYPRSMLWNLKNRFKIASFNQDFLRWTFQMAVFEELYSRSYCSPDSCFFIILVLLDKFNKKYKKFRDLTRNWTHITCVAVIYSNHCTRMISVLVWGCNWIQVIPVWFCPIRLIHLIGRKSLGFEMN